MINKNYIDELGNRIIEEEIIDQKGNLIKIRKEEDKFGKISLKDVVILKNV